MRISLSKMLTEIKMSKGNGKKTIGFEMFNDHSQ